MNIQPHACALLADFSRLPKGEALPCIAWLDLAESRLAPGALQRQKFVYHIAPTDRREALDKPLSPRCEEIIESRKPYLAGEDQPPFPLLKDEGPLRVSASWPILAGGDIIGMIGLLDTSEKRVSEAEEKLLYTGALFLGKLVEG